MRIKIDIEVNIDEKTVQAFAALVGEPTSKAVSEYILSQGYQGLELLLDEYDEIQEGMVPFNSLLRMGA